MLMMMLNIQTMLVSFLSSISSEDMKERAIEGLKLPLITTILTILLELWSIDTTKKVLKQDGRAGTSLYIAAVMSNIINHFVFGVPIYMIATGLFCRDVDEVTAGERIVSVGTILFVQSIGFYVAHRAFHSNPNWYRHHRFHHRFNTYVVPMAANAGEFFFFSCGGWIKSLYYVCILVACKIISTNCEYI
jgi:sterol desaturase/sphingolipid hydroxylase (fatty acid hydroxylase superfamily)